MPHFKLIGPGIDGLYKYGGASIELSSVGTTRWWATVRFKSQEIDFEARSSDEALEKSMAWVDAAPEHPRDFYGRPRPLGEARRPGSKPKYRPSKAKKYLKVARVVPEHGAWRVEFEDNFSIQVHGGSGRGDLLYAMKPFDTTYEGRSPGPETRRDYQYLALKAVLGDRPAEFVIDHDGDVMAYLKERSEINEHRVSDFNTLDDLIQHAVRDLGATHAKWSEHGEADTKLYFPRKDGRYDEAKVWKKAGYWHAQGPGSREVISHLPRGAQPLSGSDRRPNRTPLTEQRFKLGAPRPGTSVRDYIAVDRRGHTIAGPFKSYSDAKHAAGGGGAVKFVPSSREVSEAKRGGPKADPRAVDFFYKNAGYGHGPGETPEQGRKRGAIALAQAEQEATARGWAVEWHEDPEGWDSLGDIDPDDVKEILYAVIKDENGNVLGSLGSIVNPDRAQGRVIEAELALEALEGAGGMK